ncbi:MAG: ABC transporter ATP-binding protein [Candidatus Brocadiae bacterium]|nr:ABC transporter ATP-binding protein [Candidatus Brocadiia bacterium]
MIHIQQVSKYFGSKMAVKDLSLEVKSGEVFAFLGPNGAGKTTTIKMMVGLLQPSQGTIHINSFSMKDQYLQAKESLAYVPDQPYLYDKLSGRELLEFVGRMYNMTEEKIQEKIQTMIELFELKEYIDSLCESYSHGMKQRVVFSSALLHSPKVLILDEPMVGLDPKSARIVKNIVKEQAALGTTVFMSTHSLEVAEETATRIGIIHGGQLIVLGTLLELREKLQGKDRLEDIFLELTNQ